MPPKLRKEMVIFVLNVGTSNSIFLNKAKNTIERLTEKKIFLRPKDEVGLILMGSEVTENAYNVNNVQVLDVQVPTWNWIRTLTNMECTDKTTVSWVDALYVAANYMIEECTDAGTRSIFLFSDSLDMSEIKSQFDLDKAGSLYREKGIGFVCVGEEELDLKSNTPDSPNLEALQDFCRQVNGQYLSIDRAINDVKFFKRPAPNPAAWKCSMDVYGITIPIAGYVKVTHVAKLPTWGVKAVEEPESPVEVERRVDYLDRHRDERTEDALAGYIYGNKSVPFPDEDEAAMAYKSGPKSYKVHSFVKRSEIGIENWAGKGTRLILPENDCAAKLFYTMMRAMIDKDLVAVVRKVWRMDSTPRVVALYPRVDVPEEPWCFTEVELTFAEYRFPIETRPLTSVPKRLTKEQVEAVDGLLTSFALDKGEPNEKEKIIDGPSFLPGCVADPALQYCWDAVAARAIAPECPLPPMDDSLLALVKRPEYITTKSEEHLDRVKRLFNLSQP